MPSTMEWLESYRGGRLAMSLVFDGYDIVHCTEKPGDDISALASAFATDTTPWNQWTNIKGGLTIAGEIGQSIKLFDPSVEADALEFTLVDDDDSLLGTLLREGHSTADKTYLTSSLTASATASMAVQDTTDFDASGTVYVGHEAIGYTGKTATTITGLTRGKWSIFTRNGGGNFSPAHLVGNSVEVSTMTAPSVTSHPRTWYNRFVTLILHHYDPFATPHSGSPASVTGAWSKPTNSRQLWTGRIASYRDNGDGSVTIRCKSCFEILQTQVGSERWRARVNAGVGLPTKSGGFRAANTQSVAYAGVADLAFSGRTTHEAAAEKINEQLKSWQSGGTIHAGDGWMLRLTPLPDGRTRYVWTLAADTTAVGVNETVEVALHETVWDLLGWPPSSAHNGKYTDSNSNPVVLRRLNRISGSKYELVAPKPPILYYWQELGQNSKLYVSDEDGTFRTQDDDAIIATHDTNGVVRITGGNIGDGIYAVKYTSASPNSTIELRGKYNEQSGAFVPVDEPASQVNGSVRLGDAASIPEVAQVWFERGDAGTLLLKLLLSTGSSAHNDSTYDAYSSDFGLSVPYSLLDVPSFESLNEAKINLIVDEPRPFYEFLEPVLAVTNRYVVWASSSATTQPKISIRQLNTEGAAQSLWTLDETNKGGGGADRCVVERATDGIVNRVVLKYGTGPSGQGGQTIEINQVDSQSDFGKKRTVKIDGKHVRNADELLPATVAPALAYLSRPLAIVERSINAELIRLAPTDQVLITDNHLANPLTGTRGVTELYAWCMGVSFNFATGAGKVQLVFLPEHQPTRVGKIAPSALVDSYDAGTKTITLSDPHIFSASSENSDASYFSGGSYKVHVYALDEDPPQEWFDTVVSAAGDEIVLTTGLAGFSGSKTYVVEFDDISTVQSGQRNYAFIADWSTQSTGYSNPKPYLWGSDASRLLLSDGSIDYLTPMFQPSSTADDQGEPVSVHKFHYALLAANNMLAHKTRAHHINFCSDADRSQVGTTEEIVFMAFVPLYGMALSLSPRRLRFKVRGRQAGGGTANFKVYSSAVPPSGTSTSFNFGVDSAKYSTVVSTTSATDTWITASTVRPAPFGFGNGFYGTWISVAAYGSAGGITAYFNGFTLVEEALS